MEERFVKTQRASVTHRPAENPPQHVMTVAVARQDTVRHGKRERARVVGNDTERDVDFFLLAVTGRSRLGQSGTVTATAELFQFVEKRTKHVRVIVRNFGVREVGEAARALDHGTNTLEAHAGIDVPRGQRSKAAVRIGVELDEDQIPNLDALGAALVDELAAGVALRREIDVQLAARTARTRVAHHPEVVFFVAVDDVHGGVEPGRTEMPRPAIPSLLVERARIAVGRRIDCGVNSRRRKMPAVHQQLPRPVDGFFFEIITEAPVAEHLEKSVVVRVEPHVLEVVVFAAGTDALLRVGGSRVSRGDRSGPTGNVGFGLTKKDRHELVHPRVGEKQVGRVGQKTRGLHDGVVFLAEKLEETAANFAAGRNSLAHGLVK